MSALQSDYLQRIIEEVARAIAAAVGLRQRGELEQAQSVLADGASEALGMDFRILSRMDVSSVASLLGTPERMALLADILAESARIAAGAGKPGDAERLARRAEGLRLIARSH